MARAPKPGPYLTPIKSDGTPAGNGTGRGVFALEASTVYYCPIGSPDATVSSVHLQGLTAGLVLTAVTIEDGNHADTEAALTSTTAGEWIQENPSSAYVAVAGSGWSATNLTIASSGSALGGAVVHFGNFGTSRARLRIAVGATGGNVRISQHGKW